MTQRQSIPQVPTLRPRTRRGQCQESDTDWLCALGLFQCFQSLGELSPPMVVPRGVLILLRSSLPCLMAQSSFLFPQWLPQWSCFDKGGFSSEENTTSCLLKLRCSSSLSLLAPSAFLTEALTEGPRCRLKPWSPVLLIAMG